MRFIFAIFLASSLNQVFAAVRVTAAPIRVTSYSPITSAGEFHLIIYGIDFDNSIKCNFKRHKRYRSLLTLDKCYRQSFTRIEYLTGVRVSESFFKISSRYNIYINANVGSVYINGQVVGRAYTSFIDEKTSEQVFDLDWANVLVDFQESVITID